MRSARVAHRLRERPGLAGPVELVLPLGNGSVAPARATAWGDLKSSAVPTLNGNGHSSKLYDPAFTGNRVEPLHRWVPWIAGYSSRFVDEVLEKYNGHPGKTRVLDPFAGVGTTLVEARFRGSNALGFEINPWPALVSRTKLAAGTDLRAEALRSAISDYGSYADSHRDPDGPAPEGFHTRIPFFSAPIERKVRVALDFIREIEDPWVRDAFRVALGASMVSFSNYTYEPSLCSRPGAGKALVETAKVEETLTSKLNQMANDVAAIETSGTIADTERTVHTGSFLDYADFEGRSRSHLAITSPPYLNNYHYVRNTRPQMWWLGLVAGRDGVAAVESGSMGKYWQTTRALDNVDLIFRLPSLEATLATLRETRKGHGIYGGAGWANYAATYFNDTYHYLSVLRRALFDGGHAVILIGNSILQGIPIPTDRYLAEVAKEVGFEHEATNLLRDTRVGGSIVSSSVRRGAKPGAAVGLYEAAVILRRGV